MFVINLNYKIESEIIDQFLINHIEFLDKYFDNNNFIISGRKILEAGEIITNNMTYKELNEIIKLDPVYINNVTDYKITELHTNKIC